MNVAQVFDLCLSAVKSEDHRLETCATMRSSPTILLAAHGARTGSEANLLVEALAERLRARRPDLTFQPAYNLGEPRFPEAVTLAGDGDIIVVPVMTGRGYFVDERLPIELAKSPTFDAARVKITAPVGSVPAVMEDVLRRAVEAWAGCGQDAVALVVGHGTTRSTRSRSSSAAIAHELATRLPPGADVRACFLDDKPLLEDIAATLGERPILVVPWLLGGGGHYNDDIRERLGDAFSRATVLRPLGELACLDDAVLSLIDEQLARSMSVPLMPEVHP